MPSEWAGHTHLAWGEQMLLRDLGDLGQCTLTMLRPGCSLERNTCSSMVRRLIFLFLGRRRSTGSIVVTVRGLAGIYGVVTKKQQKKCRA